MTFQMIPRRSACRSARSGYIGIMHSTAFAIRSYYYAGPPTGVRLGSLAAE